MALDLGVQRGLVGALDRHGNGFPAAFAHPEDRLLADGAAPCVQPLVPVLVLLLPADVRLVDLDDAAQLVEVPAARFPEPPQHEPRCLLRHADLLRDLHGGNALAGGHNEVDRPDPLVQLDVRPLEDGPGADRELLRASPAAMVAEPLPLAGRDLVAAAVWADRLTVPPLRFEIHSGRFRVREPLEELKQADRHAVVQCHFPSPRLTVRRSYSGG